MRFATMSLSAVVLGIFHGEYPRNQGQLFLSEHQGP